MSIKFDETTMREIKLANSFPRDKIRAYSSLPRLSVIKINLKAISPRANSARKIRVRAHAHDRRRTSYLVLVHEIYLWLYRSQCLWRKIFFSHFSTLATISHSLFIFPPIRSTPYSFSATISRCQQANVAAA